MGIYVKFYYDHLPNMAMDVTLAANFENFYFSPNSILTFRNVQESYQIWGKLAQEQKVTGKKQNSGWNPPPTSAYRVNLLT